MGEPTVSTENRTNKVFGQYSSSGSSSTAPIEAGDYLNGSRPIPVESQNEVITVPYQTPTMVHETSNQVSNQNFKGYSIDDLKKYLKPSCRDIDNMTAEELINLAQTRLEKELEFLETHKAYLSFETEGQKAIFEKLYPGEDGIERAIIEAYFDVGVVFDAIWKIEGEYPNALNLKTEELHKIYYRESISCAKWNQEYSNSPELQNLFKNLDGKSLEEKKSTIIKYLSGLYEANPDKNALLETFRNILVTIPEDDNETRKALLSAIVLLSEEKYLDTFKDILYFCRNDSEKAESIMTVDIDTMKNCAKNMFMYILEQYDEGGLVAEEMISKGVTPDAIDKIRAALDAAKEGGEFVIDDELKNIFNAYKNYISGLETIVESLKSRPDITPEDLETVCNIHGTAATIIGEAGMRDYWASWYEKLAQNPDLVQNIGQKQLDYILNKISNGNYQIVVEDILRGDGVHSPLNMSAPEGNVPQGDGASIPEGGYDQSSGGYYVNPSVNYETQSAYISTLQQNIYMNSNLSPLPQRVAEETPTQNTPTISSNHTLIKSAQECKEYLKNNANGVRDFLTGKVKSASSSVSTMIIEKYKTLGKEQGGILAASRTEFFSKLQGVTKISAIRSFFAAGGKGINFDRTEAMQEMIKEDDEKKKNKEVV